MLKFRITKPKFITLIAIGILILISIPPRLWELKKYPPVIVDEPAYIRDIDKILSSPHFQPAQFQWDWSQASLAYYPAIFLIKNFSVTDKQLSLRYVSIIFSILSLIPMFFLIKKRTNTTIAFCTTLLFSSSYYFLQFSRVGWGVIYPVSLGLYLFWILESYLVQKRIWQLVTAALLAGLIFYGYRGGQVYIITAFLFISFLLYSSLATWVKKIYLFLAFTLIFLIISLPWGYNIFTNWEQYDLRLRVVSVNNSAKPYHGLEDMPSIYHYQITTAFRAWVLLEPIDGGGIENSRYLPLKDPPVNFFIRILFLGGLIIAVSNFRRYWWWFAIFILGLILGQIKTVDPPNGARALVFLPVIYLFASLPLYYLYQKASSKKLLPISYIFISLILAYNDFHYYQYWMTWIKI